MSDAGSGLSAFVVSTDGGAYSAYLNPIFFTEGVHTVRFRATDYAGNVTETAQQTVNVDTTTPAISLSISGTLGTNGWYKSNVTVKANVSDATSAIGLVEASTDGGAWAMLSQVSFSDGPHSYQFKVTDNAGNNTTIPLQNLKIDTIAPAIDMTAELSLGETVYYDLQDNGSGLSIYRAVIEDEDERYKKVVWLDTLGGNKLRDQIRWDGKFADGAQAGWGQYFITLKISDAAGNETMRSAVVTVNPFSFLQEIPAFTPPLTTTLPASGPQTDSAPVTTFGGENNNTSGGATVTTNEGGQSNPASDGTTTTSSTTGNIPNPFANVTTLSGDGSTADTSGQALPGNLLGTIGMVAAGAIAYETYRRREEEEQQILNSGVVNPVISSGGDKGLSMVVAPVIPSQPAAGGPPWWEWIVQTWQSGVTTAQQMLDAAKQKLQDSFIGQAIPELTWTPLTAAENQTVLQNVTSFSSQGAAATAFLQQQNTGFGYFPQPTGAGWTMLNNMILMPGVNLNSPYNNSLIIHEALHLEQGYLTRFSVYGELLAWQLQYQAYYDATGKYFGEKGADFYDPTDPIKSVNWEKNWRALSLLDPNSLVDLATAQQLMVDISPGYRSKSLPLEPITKTISRQVTKLGDAASNAINSAAQKAATAITQNGQTLANKITNLGTSAATRITQASTAVANAVTVAGQTVAKAVTQVSQAASNVIKQGGQAVANLASKISLGLGSSIVKTSNVVASIAVKTGQFVSTATNTVSQAASNVIKQGGQVAAKVTTSASKAVATTVTNVSKAAATTVTKVAQSAGNAVKSVASSISKFFWKP